jgi:5-methylcytosine-specific restriction enzyme subunit McrC
VTLAPDDRLIGKIPVANIWLLFLYASDLARFKDELAIEVEEDQSDLPSLVARVLVYAVDRRLRRNLSRGYAREWADLGRVRGRIDVLNTFSRNLLSRGRVACRFEDLTMNTPRNRYVRTALLAIGGRLQNKALSHACKTQASVLGRLGVGSVRPSRAEMAVDVIGRNEVQDRLMVALAELAFDLALPTEDPGEAYFASALRDRSASAMGKVFERAVGGFYQVELSTSEGWSVARGARLRWPIEEPSAGINAILPSMITDIVIDNRLRRRRILIDTKFTNILKPGWHRKQSLDPSYIYQIFSYLRSQAGHEDALWHNAEGLLIHPTVDDEIDETVTVQGHRLRFATVNLMAPTMSIRDRLRRLVDPGEPTS